MRKTFTIASLKAVLFVLVLMCGIKGRGQVNATASTSLTTSSAITEAFTNTSGTNAFTTGFPAAWSLVGTGTQVNLNTSTPTTSSTNGGWYGNADLGFLGTGNASAGNATWRLQNNTGVQITGFVISYKARMYKSGSASPFLKVYYGTNGTGTVPAQGMTGFTILSTLSVNDATFSGSVNTTGIILSTAPSNNVSGLTIGTGNYIYLRFIFDGGSSSDLFSIDDVTITPTFSASITTYYYDGSGDLNNINNWFSIIGGAGNSATTDGKSFLSDNINWEIQNDVSTSNGTWTVSGTNSKVVLGNTSVAAKTLTVTSGNPVVATLDVTAASSGTNTLTLQDATIPSFGTLNANSTVIFDGAVSQTIPAATYGNVTIQNGAATKSLGGNISLSTGSSFTLASGTELFAGTNTITFGTGGTASVSGTFHTSNSTGFSGGIGTSIVSTNSPTMTTSGSTIDYSSSSSQTITAGTYTNITNSGNGARTLANGSIAISGNYTPTSATITVGTGTIDYNGIASQSIAATSYYNLTISGNKAGGVITLSPGTINLANAISITATNTSYTASSNTVSFSGSTAVNIPALGSSAYNILNIAGSNTKTLAADLSAQQVTVSSGGNLSTGTKTITLGAGGSALINGTLQIGNAAGLIAAAGAFSNATGTTASNIVFASGSTVNYNGSTNQTVTSATYGNLTITGRSGTITLQAGTINITGNGTFISGGTTLWSNTANTVDYSGSSSQTIGAFSYNNLSISGAKTTATITLASSGTIDIAGTFDVTATGVSAYIGTGSAVNFSSASSQTIPAITYNNLTNTGNGSRILASTGTTNIAGTFTVGSGTYNIGTSTVNFTGTVAQTIPVLPVLNGSNYYNLSKSGSGTATLANSLNVENDLSVSLGTLAISASASNTLTIKGSILQSGGTIDFSSGNTTSSTIVLSGNFSQTGTSIITTNGTNATNGLLIFAGTTEQLITYAGSDDIYINYRINDAAIVTLGSNIILIRDATSQYASVVNIGQGTSGTLNTAAFSFTTSGTTGTNATININNGASILLSNGGGLNTVFPQANTTRIFSAGVNYTFNASTITAFPTSTQQASFGNPNNVTANANITLNRDITITGVLNLTDKIVTNTGNSLTLSGTVSRTTGTITGTGTTVFVGPSSISDGLFASNTVAGNLTINKASGVSQSSNLTVTGALTLINGQLIIGSNTLALNGSITGSGTLSASLTSNLTIGGTGALGSLNFDQTIDGTTNVLNNFTMNRTSGTATLGNKLVLLDTYTPTAGVLTTGGFLTLRSTAAKTARIAQGDVAGGYISGDLTAERFIPGGTNTSTITKRAFRFIAHPFNGNVALSQLTDNIDITGSGGSANGFTSTGSNNPSAFYYDPTSGSNAEDANGAGWKAFTNTNGTAPNTWGKGQGIRAFIRGAKGQGLSGATDYIQSDVTLDMLGTLNVGDQTLNLPATGTSVYRLVGNPFASAVDLKNVARPDIGSSVYVWDLAMNAGVGGYRTIDFNALSTYILPAYSSFFATVTGAAPAMVFEEADKSSNAATNQLFRTSSTINALELELKSGDILWDVFALKTHPNAIALKDSFDAGKLYNSVANLYSIATDGKEYAIDYRNLKTTDVVRLAMYANVKRDYTIHVSDAGLASTMFVYLKDKYINAGKLILLSSGSDYTFTVNNDPASQGENRFELVFAPNATLPIMLSSVKAYQKAQGIQVDWISENETNVEKYEVEKSADGQNFTKANTVNAKGNGSISTDYNFFDASPLQGNNFYRIKVIEKSGTVKYGSVVRVNIGKGKAELLVYPNPVKGKVISVQLNNLDKGRYTVTLTNNLGQQVYSTVLVHAGGSSAQTLSINKEVATGIYRIQVSNENFKMNKTIILQ